MRDTPITRSDIAEGLRGLATTPAQPVVTWTTTRETEEALRRRPDLSAADAVVALQSEMIEEALERAEYLD